MNKLPALALLPFLLMGCERAEDTQQAHFESICKGDKCDKTLIPTKICPDSRAAAIAYEKAHQTPDHVDLESFEPKVYVELLTTHLECLEAAKKELPTFQSVLKGKVKNEIAFAKDLRLKNSQKIQHSE